MKIRLLLVISSVISVYVDANSSTSTTTSKTISITSDISVISVDATSTTIFQVKNDDNPSTTSSPLMPFDDISTPKCNDETKRKCILEICAEGFIVSKNSKLGLGNCCPVCVRELKLNEQCYPGDETKGMCGIGLKCVQNKKKSICQKESCIGWTCPLKNKDLCIYHPTCDADGSFSAKQCKGQKFSGRCFCYNSEGSRIFGQEWLKQAENITCNCARKVDKLRRERAFSGDITMHCTSTGDWEALQCDSGVCWCADEHTGRPLTRIIPETMKISLPCYSSDDPSYQRQCESALYSSTQITKLMQIRGTSFGTSTLLFCDPDGSYGSYQLDANLALFCSGQDKSHLIGSSPLDDIGNLDCNCARDSKVYYQDAHLTFTQICDNNGNYKKLQIANFKGQSSQYCCDKDGFPLTNPVPSSEKPLQC